MTQTELVDLLKKANTIRSVASRPDSNWRSDFNDEQDSLVAAAILVGFAHLAEVIEEKLDEISARLDYSS